MTSIVTGGVRSTLARHISHALDLEISSRIA